MYEPDNKTAMSELYFIKTKAPNDYEEPTLELLKMYSQKYDYPSRAFEDVIGLASAYSRKALEENETDLAIYFLEIYCDLTDDEEATAVLERLMKQDNEE